MANIIGRFGNIELTLKTRNPRWSRYNVALRDIIAVNNFYFNLQDGSGTCKKGPIFFFSTKLYKLAHKKSKMVGPFNINVQGTVPFHENWFQQ